jgi:ABC-type transport system substrate-binding protein
VTNDKAHHRRRRGVWLGLLTVLLLALAGVAYAVTSSPSASPGLGKDKPSATPTSSVLAPSAPQTTTPSTGSNTGAGTQIVLAPASTGNGNGNGNCVDPASESANCPHSFGVMVGAAQTLYPGVARSLPVTYSNPNNFDIFISTYRVSVSVPSTQAAACPASNLLVPSGTVTLTPQLAVAKIRSVLTTIPIRLSANAPEGCQRVTFTITVSASAVKK